MAREAVGQAVGAELTPDTMVSPMLQSERIWTLIESCVTVVIKTRELDRRRDSNNGEGQQIETTRNFLDKRYFMLKKHKMKVITFP